MPSNMYQRSAMAVAIAACFPGAVLAAGVARVDFASGNVAAISVDGKSRALAKGSEIEVGETISTQAGRAQLRFSDGAYMSLQPQTEFKIEEFKFSGKAEPSDNIVMNLLKGGMRTITGLIGRNNRNAYRLKTDVATIGIRGTEYTVKYTNSIEVFVADGVVSVENQSGSFTVPGGSGVMVSNQQTPPQQTDQKPVLPPESPSQQEQEKQQQQVADPVNPIQESSPPVPTVAQLLTGTITGHWAVVHPGNYFTVGLNQAITLDAAGTMTSFVDTFEGTATASAGSASSSGNDGVIAWGRWANGTIQGNHVVLSGLNTIDPDSALHYVVGLPAANLPTGSATYSMISMIGATPPSSFESVTLDSSTLSINFGSSSGTFHAGFTVNGSAVTTMAPGVAFSVASGGRLIQTGSGNMSGPFCTQNIGLQGFLAGEAAARAGMAYILSTSAGNAHGAIAYKKD